MSHDCQELHISMVEGIAAHILLSQNARDQAESLWLASGGAVLLEHGEQTDEYQTHRELFVEAFVDDELRIAYGGRDKKHASVSKIAVGMHGRCKTNIAALTAVRRPHASTAHEHFSDDALHAEARLVAERSLPGRPHRKFVDIHDAAVFDGWSWKLSQAADWQLYSNLTADRCTPPLLKRRVTDKFCDAQVCRELCGYAIHAMRGARTACGQTAIAAGPCLGLEAEALVTDIVQLARIHIAREFGLPSMPFFAGASLTRLLPDISATSADNEYPYHAHVDRARVMSDDYASVLHLTTQGIDFAGGDFVFVDAIEDILVSPCRGRLVSFTCGPENLHRVTEVVQGARLTLAMWFTLSEHHAVHMRSHVSSKIFLRCEDAQEIHRTENSSTKIDAALLKSMQSSQMDQPVHDNQYELVD